MQCLYCTQIWGIYEWNESQRSKSIWLLNYFQSIDRILKEAVKEVPMEIAWSLERYTFTLKTFNFLLKDSFLHEKPDCTSQIQHLVMFSNFKPCVADELLARLFSVSLPQGVGSVQKVCLELHFFSTFDNWKILQEIELIAGRRSVKFQFS